MNPYHRVTDYDESWRHGALVAMPNPDGSYTVGRWESTQMVDRGLLARLRELAGGQPAITHTHHVRALDGSGVRTFADQHLHGIAVLRTDYDHKDLAARQDAFVLNPGTALHVHRLSHDQLLSRDVVLGPDAMPAVTMMRRVERDITPVRSVEAFREHVPVVQVHLEPDQPFDRVAQVRQLADGWADRNEYLWRDHRDVPTQFAWVGEVQHWTETAEVRGFHWRDHVYYTDPSTAKTITTYSQRTDVSLDAIDRTIAATIADGRTVQGPSQTGPYRSLNEPSGEYRMWQSTLDELRLRVPEAWSTGRNQGLGSGWRHAGEQTAATAPDAAVLEYGLNRGWLHDISYKDQHSVFLSKAGWDAPHALSQTQSHVAQVHQAAHHGHGEGLEP